MTLEEICEDIRKGAERFLVLPIDSKKQAEVRYWLQTVRKGTVFYDFDDILTDDEIERIDQARARIDRGEYALHEDINWK